MERGFHDVSFFPPRSSGDLAKIIAWVVFRSFMLGTVGGQIVLYAVKTLGCGATFKARSFGS
jgi:hypothetical protein